MGGLNKMNDNTEPNAATQQLVLDRKQKSMAIAVKLQGEDELSAAPLLLKQNANRQILRGCESLND